MAKLTLLDMTQDILSSMGGDLVNSIGQTEESRQVSNIIKNAYYNIINERDWPFMGQLAQLTGLGDLTNPTRTQIPDNVSRVCWIKYDVAVPLAGPPDEAPPVPPRNMQLLTHKAPQDFMDILDNRSSGDVNTIAVTDPSNVSMNIINNKAPEFWTSFDDEFIYFDSYDNTIDNTIQQSKTSTHAIIEPAWSHIDTFVPDMPTHMFPMLLAQAKTVSTRKLKQEVDKFEERDAKRQRTRIQATSWRQNGSDILPNYGRK